MKFPENLIHSHSTWLYPYMSISFYKISRLKKFLLRNFF